VIEEEWIAKYRAALIATQIKPSRAESIIAGLKGITQELVSVLSKASHNKTTAQSDGKPFYELRRPTLARAPAREHNPQTRSEASSVQSPRKQHLSGQPRRRRAS
jgi:hypothetical protein